MSINPFDLIKNFKDIQNNIGDMQSKLKDLKVLGSAGGDMVKVEMNGAFEILDINISKEAVDPNDIEMLQDLIRAAFNNAIEKAKEKGARVALLRFGIVLDQKGGALAKMLPAFRPRSVCDSPAFFTRDV